VRVVGHLDLAARVVPAPLRDVGRNAQPAEPGPQRAPQVVHDRAWLGEREERRLPGEQLAHAGDERLVGEVRALVRERARARHHESGAPLSLGQRQEPLHLREGLVRQRQAPGLRVRPLPAPELLVLDRHRPQAPGEVELAPLRAEKLPRANAREEQQAEPGADRCSML
jgi:hypothetical protein